MNARQHYLSRLRFIFTVLLGILPIILTACGSTNSHHPGWYGSETADFSKIFVEPFKISPYARLPDGHADSGLVLTYVLGKRLAERNLLQTDLTKVSLRISGTFLYFQDSVLYLAAELWDGDRYLTFSQIQHELEPDNDWNQEIAVIGAVLLDDLMQKLSLLGDTEYNAYLLCPSIYAGGGGYESARNRSTPIVRHPSQADSRHGHPDTHGRDDHRHENGRDERQEQNGRTDSNKEVFGGDWRRHDREIAGKTEKSASSRDNHADHEANPAGSEHWPRHETDISRHEATSGAIALPNGDSAGHHQGSSSNATPSVAEGNTPATSHSSSSIGLPSGSSSSTASVSGNASSVGYDAPGTHSSSSYGASSGGSSSTSSGSYSSSSSSSSHSDKHHENDPHH